DADRVFNVARLHNGPRHVIFPEIFEENIKTFKSIFAKESICARIYLAHKPNKSKVFLKQALHNGICVDVASEEELAHALSVGFTGGNIGCTGAKNRGFLSLALFHGCLVSIDSVQELDAIIQLRGTLTDLPPTPILIRISDPQSKDRNLTMKVSRFGLSRHELPAIYEKLKKQDGIVWRGFHFHNYEPSEAKAGFTEDLLGLMEDSYKQGFSPDLIDIGGGFRTEMLENYEEWPRFIEQLASAMQNNTDTSTWRNYTYDLFLNQKGTISGRDKLQGQFAQFGYESLIKGILENEVLRGRPLKDFIKESMFSLMIEPGSSIFDQAGISLLSVVGIKKTANGENLIVVDGNIYNLSTYMVEPLMDPVLIPQTLSEQAPFEGYLVGNLCKEGDIIMKRKVFFKALPREGDILCFINTAAYSSDFEDTNAHLHPVGKKFVAFRGNESKWSLYSEDAYNPF
ncbi:MAG TPA: hypothetical protein VMT81_03785, partial [Candidatus Paceibacterota bacterium]|nr:hypothetical protein [Candidatus Paceibacterota bacterium]